MIFGRAPGKAVLWGEYAVLASAPAVVAAVNRHAVCELAKASAYRFAATGFQASAVRFRRPPVRPPTSRPAALLAWHVLELVGWKRVGPASVVQDSGAFYRQGGKLGFGSSAALCVALEGAAAHLAGEAPNFHRAREAHRRFQGGQGSGIDVAAAFFGGVLRCQGERVAPLHPDLPPWRILWTGEGASTRQQLSRFAAYLKRGDLSALERLGVCSERLCEAPAADRVQEYASALKHLDAAADLGIFTPAHRRAERLASRYNLAYKPCGAGGGDLGMAVGESPQHLAPFRAAAQASGFKILKLQTAKQGIQCP